MTWQWSQSAHRYRDSETGQFLSRERALEFVQESLNATDNVSDVLASYVGGDEPMISHDDWRAAMRREIKDEYIRQYILGRGGREQMTAVDWGSLGGMIGSQYKPYLEDFLAQIEAGELSEGQIRARARMYINSAREAYERAQARVAAAAGYDEARWVLNPGSDNCEDCIAFAEMGWTLVADNAYKGCYPASGCTACLTNCACHKEYRASVADGEIAEDKVFADKKEAAEWLDEQPGVNPSLSDAESKALEEYKGEDFYDINSDLREYGYSEDERVDKIEAAIARTAITQPLTVYRGTDIDVLDDENLTDATIEDGAFISTSLIESVAAGHADGATIEIRLPAGIPALNMERWRVAGWVDGEAELLLQRGTKFRVIEDNYEEDQDERYLIVEAIYEKQE